MCKQSVFRLAGESSIGTEVGLRDSSKYTVCLGTFGCGEVFVVFVGTVHHSGVTRQQYCEIAGLCPQIMNPKHPISLRLRQSGILYPIQLPRVKHRELSQRLFNAR